MPAIRTGAGIASWLLITAAAVLLLSAMSPQPVSACLFRRLSGIPCPGCGLTRAFVALLRGDWSDVWRMHPLAPLLALEWAAIGVWAAGSRFRLEKNAERLILGNAALLFLLWGSRIYFHALPW